MALAARSNLRRNIYLIGNCSQQIVGSKLPSNKQVLSALFYNIRQVNLSLRDSARLAIQEVVIFWNKARIPTREVKHCIDKLEALYGEWRALQKHAGRASESNKQKENLFVSCLDDLFDIAHANALQMINIEEDKQFLISQRQKGRPGYMSGIDYELDRKERKISERVEKALIRKQRSILELEGAIEPGEITSSNSSGEEESIQKNDGTIVEDQQEEHSEHSALEEKEPGPSQTKRRKARARRDIFTPKLVAVFDKCKVTDRDAVHILMATAEALGHDIQNLVINRSSIRRIRQRIRQERAENLKKQFNVYDLKAAVVHWDGKLLPAITGHNLVERLPVIVTSEDIEQILGIPTLQAGTGKDQASAIYEALSDWGLTETVRALCCDTTASNTGHLKGACILLEQMLERDLLYLPCRHHIYEIILKSVFDEKMPSSTTGPSVPIFKRFQQSWSKIDKNKFKSGIKNENIKKILHGNLGEILAFVKSVSESQCPRDDYREFLELTAIFLGDIPARGISFRIPGAVHHARWMGKAIYCFKIFLFRDEFKLTTKERSALSDICIFLVSAYIQVWFGAPSAAKAPNQDLQFIKRLLEYKMVDPDISRVALNKFRNHLWYLSPEATALAFFDPNLSFHTKSKMIEALNRYDRDRSQNECVKRALIKVQEIPEMAEKGIEHFVSAETPAFFERFNLCTQFLHTDPSTWSENDSFKKGFEIVNKLKVVNDTAERGVKLMEEYNKLITKNEDQKQFVLQIVSDYRRRFPCAKKETLLQQL